MSGTGHRHWIERHRGRAWQVVGRLCRVGVLLACGIAGGTVAAQAANAIVVPRDFPTIQAAVDAAVPGATIKVRRGTYTEQIVLAKDVILTGEGADGTIIKAPATLTPYAVDAFTSIPVGAIVRSTDGAHVRMSGLTVTGPTPCFAVSGVVAVKGSTLHLSDAHVTLIYPEDLNCPIAFRSSGVVIGLPAFIVIDGEAEGGSIAHGTVTGVAIDQCLTTGIAVLGPFDGPPSTATITDNVITGGVPFATPGQAGVTVSFASVARVTDNTISDTVCTAPECGRDPITEFQSVGIGGNSNPPGTVIEGNTVSGSDVGIYLFGSDGCCRTRDNRLTDNRFFGIVIQDGRNETAENRISGGEVGIGVVADAVDTVALSREDRIKRTSVAPVLEIECCGFTATVTREN
jgi:Right handed beta helix region